MEESEFNKIIHELKYFIKTLAKNFARTLPSDVEDYIQEAYVAIWRSRKGMGINFYKKVARFAMNTSYKGIKRANKKLRAYSAWWIRAFRDEV